MVNMSTFLQFLTERQTKENFTNYLNESVQESELLSHEDKSLIISNFFSWLASPSVQIFMVRRYFAFSKIYLANRNSSTEPL